MPPSDLPYLGENPSDLKFAGMLTKHATHAQARAATLAEAVLLRDAKLLLDRESVGADARACGGGVGEEGRVGTKAEKPVAAATGSAEFWEVVGGRTGGGQGTRRIWSW